MPRVSVAVTGDRVIVGSGGPRVARAASVTGDRGLRRSLLQQDQASARVRGHEPNTVRSFRRARTPIATRSCEVVSACVLRVGSWRVSRIGSQN